ncbi:Reverse transcriptase Ty1/copia-type domain-containing protein [Abeliophyllum distichum]|uniref:Reverse transcriptase Ty1/copia-type domain-containing protein n=1 Tax=Abeliophyllum distichum TaxID=126358 RepID=A0ABD1SYW2_9LAMI
MRDVLVQQKVAKAIKGMYPETMYDDQQAIADELAYISIILHLSDQVLRKMTTLNHVVNKLVQDTNTGKKVSGEYKAVILLNAIPEVYMDVKNAIKYGRDTLSQDVVVNSLRSKDMELKTEKADSSNSESLHVRGRSQNSSDLPKVLWGETVMTASYIGNRTPLSAIDGKTPKQQWPRKFPDYSHLRTFGCAAYSHQSIGKLEARAQKCVFLEYLDGVKEYRFWEGEIDHSTKFQVVFTTPTERINQIQVEPEYEVETEHNNQDKDDVGHQEDDDVAQNIHHPDLEDYQLARDRTRRDIRAPLRFGD